MPLVGAVLAIANLFFFEDDEIDAETALRTHIGEFAYKGTNMGHRHRCGISYGPV